MSQSDLFEAEATRKLLDRLLAESSLYKNGAEFQELLAFVVRMRNFAPFNAMLLQLQKPGLMYAASSLDWLERFNRTLKIGARPLLILWPFAPVALVYDVEDTEGPELPVGVSPFAAAGEMDDARIDGFLNRLRRQQIEWRFIDAGSGSAGSITVTHRPEAKGGRSAYLMLVNRNHGPNVQFATIVHELGHLCLGHLGKDSALSIPDRRGGSHARRELEAESVSYLVCERSGVSSRADTYLSEFVESDMVADDLDLYQITRAAGQVETLLGLGMQSRFGAAC
jgi:hypothetical protein